MLGFCTFLIFILDRLYDTICFLLSSKFFFVRERISFQDQRKYFDSKRLGFETIIVQMLKDSLSCQFWVENIDQYFRNVDSQRWKYVGYQYWYNVGNWCCTNAVQRYHFDCPPTVGFRQLEVGIQRWIDGGPIVNFC